MKARAIRIEANLPAYLWPWCTQTAGFLTNRTLMNKHKWKTPFQAVTSYRLNLSHLKAFRYKAYPLDKSIPRKEKMAPRAYLGFLVGYEGTNIYNIWIPSLYKVIRTRDITFDEALFYKPDEIDIIQLEKEPFLHSIFEIPYIEPSHVIEDLSSDSDEDDYTTVTPPTPITPPTPATPE